MKDELPRRIPEPEFGSPEQTNFFFKHNKNVDMNTVGKFISGFLAKQCPNFAGGRALEIGCGSSALSVCLALHYPGTKVVAIDGCPLMFGAATGLVRKLGMTNRVNVKKVHVPHDELDEKPYSFDLVFSRSALHQFHNPLDFWRVAKRYLKADGSLFVFDLVRPKIKDDAREWVGRRTHPDCPKHHRDAYYASLLSSYRPAEVADQLKEVGFPGDLKIQQTHPLHMVIWR